MLVWHNKRSRPPTKGRVSILGPHQPPTTPLPVYVHSAGRCSLRRERQRRIRQINQEFIAVSRDQGQCQRGVKATLSRSFLSWWQDEGCAGRVMDSRRPPNEALPLALTLAVQIQYSASESPPNFSLNTIAIGAYQYCPAQVRLSASIEYYYPHQLGSNHSSVLNVMILCFS